MAGEQSSRSRTTRNKGAATKAAKKKRARHHAETSKDLSRAGDGSQERPSRGGEHAEPAALESLSLDGMPDQQIRSFLSPYGTGLPCFVLLRRSTTPEENLSIPHGSLLLLRSSAHLYEQSNHKAPPSSSNEPSNHKGPRLS